MQEITSSQTLASLEQWKVDLAMFIVQAEKDHKLIRSKYQQLVFTPKGLATEILRGRFIWGIVNWELIDPKPGICIDYPDPEESKCLVKF